MPLFWNLIEYALRDIEDSYDDKNDEMEVEEEVEK